MGLQAAIPAAALGLAMLLGGGGSPAPGFELALQLASAVLFGAWVWYLPKSLGESVPRRARIIAALIVALPLIQLIPLPPALWQALPERAIERDALALVGASNEWRSWSMAPDRTLAAVLAMLPPLALLAMTAAADRHGRRLLAVAAALAAGLTVVLGAAQLSGGPGSALRFHSPLATSLDGFQANRNSTADVLLVGLIAFAALLRERAHKRSGLLMFGGGALVAALAVVLTGSRTGIVLIPLALAGAVAVLGKWVRLPLRKLAIAAAALLLAGVVGTAMLKDNAALNRVASRFEGQGELRPDLWRDSLYVARQHMPFGVGAGNFVPAMIAAERLEIVRPALPNRAHNDYLELAVEGGLFAIGLLLAVCALLAAAAWRAWRNPPEGSRALAAFGGCGLLLLGLHSLVDYPFRSMALASLGAVCAGLLLHRPSGRNQPGQSGQAEEPE